MRRSLPILTTLALLAASHAALGQQLESTPRPAGEHPKGYLAPGVIDYRTLLPAPPSPGSAVDTLDVSAVTALQASASSDRWTMASDDAEFVYPRFEGAFGAPIDRAHAPILVAMLNRVIRDVVAPTFAAKEDFARVRPYQRNQLARVCGEAVAPAPEPNPVERSSFPSGHSAYGWSVAMVLAQVAPDRAASILGRAVDYGLSREICGAHFPSDVEAGRVLATAVVTRLEANPEFERDLSAARAEHMHVGQKR
jgi:acid phosphatase (class A)